MRTDIDGLDEAIKNELENWSNGELRRAVNESLEETAAAAAESLRRGGPYRERTGKYTKDWTHDQRSSRTSVITGIEWVQCLQQKTLSVDPFTGKRAPVTQGRQERIGNVKAFEHIAPVNETREIWPFQKP